MDRVNPGRIRHGAIPFLVLALALGGRSLPAPPPPAPVAPAAPPAGNRDRHGPKDVPTYIKMLEDPKRDPYQKPDEVVAALKLAPDAAVADLGCGPGYFTLRFARAVPKGVVYAIDVEPKQLDRLNEHLTKSGVRNVVPVLSTHDDSRLPPASVDVVAIIDTYHHFEDRVKYMERLKDALKPGGRVAIVDYHKKKLPVGPPPEHKMAREDEMAEMEKAGYHLVEEPAILPYQYFLIFQAVP